MTTKILPAILALTSLCPGYTVHEWGTFTSVSSSDGQRLPGLEREEESLPPFVESLQGMQNQGPIAFGSKGFGVLRPLRNVTIKMETPVIYFYSEKPFKASVSVGFDGGAISQWYPSRSSGETAPPIAKKYSPMSKPPKAEELERFFIERGGIDFAKHRKGSITWDDIEVLPPETSRGLSFKSGETLNWVRPRNPKANILKVGDQYEDYLFYRGVGNFDLPVTFTVDGNETLHLDNQGDEDIPFFFVQEVLESGQVRFFSSQQALKAGAKQAIPESELKTSRNGWHRPVYETMFSGLKATGLTAEECHGMIQTWWHSYFEKPGLRVFWIVPDQKTNDLLPLKISPQPEKTVRVLVGRSEVLRPRFEKQLVQAYKDRNDKKKSFLWTNLIHQRYGLAYQHRIEQLVDQKVAVVK